ncbi:DUF2807 domain-containing protein [Weeksellaceae bacterium TAE3-ERU29]|nr:DUF2807 domain-containing protein [Weeksellaceae bacterium TAE3-ERU29]
MKKLFLLFLIGFCLTSCKKGITGEGTADIAQDYKISNFTEIEAKGIFKLMLVESDSTYVSVQTHENLIQNMDISTSGNTLKISEKKGVDSFESYEVYVYYNQPIEEISIDGKILLESAGVFRGNELDLETKDNSRIDLFNVDLKQLDIEAEENSEITLQGNTTKLNIKKAKGTTVLNLSDLVSSVVNVNLSDEAKVKINVVNELNGRVQNNASLEYFGNPKKDVDVKERGIIKNN